MKAKQGMKAIAVSDTTFSRLMQGGRRNRKSPYQDIYNKLKRSKKVVLSEADWTRVSTTIAYFRRRDIPVHSRKLNDNRFLLWAE